MRIVKISLVIWHILFLSACLSPSQLEETAIISTRGIDLIEQDGKQMIESTIIPFIFDPDAAESTSLLIGKGNTIKEARRDAEKQSSFPLEPGKINVDLYGIEAARAGILPFLNTLIRDARVSDRMQLAVSSQTAREFLEQKQRITTANTTEYIQDLTKKEVDLDLLPRHTLDYFTRLASQVGIDPVLPILSFKEDKPAITNVALFENDRYVGEVSLAESFLINQLKTKVSETPIDARVPTDKYKDRISYENEATQNNEFIYLSFILRKGSGTIKIDDFDALTFKAEVQMRAELLETSIPMDIKTEETTKKLEKDIEDYYKKEYEKLFDKLQEVKSDAFGLGRQYVATRRGSKTTDEEWREKYQDASVEFKVDFLIEHFGTID